MRIARIAVTDDDVRYAAQSLRRSPGFALTAILVLLVLVILYYSGEVVLPILFAFLLNLLLQPAMNALIRVHVPKTIAALSIILLFIGAVTGIGFSLSGPAAEWISKAPQSIARLEERLSAITLPVAIFQKASQDVEKFAGGQGGDVTSVSLRGPGLGSVLFSSARTMVAEFATMTLLLFFLLRSGDLFLRRIVEILPTLSDKKQAVEMSRRITPFRDCVSVLRLIALLRRQRPEIVHAHTPLGHVHCGLSYAVHVD